MTNFRLVSIFFYGNRYQHGEREIDFCVHDHELSQSLGLCRTSEQYLSKCDRDLCHGQDHRFYTEIISPYIDL